jgi:hypothetical protein
VVFGKILFGLEHTIQSIKISKFCRIYKTSTIYQNRMQIFFTKPPKIFKSDLKVFKWTSEYSKSMYAGSGNDQLSIFNQTFRP